MAKNITAHGGELINRVASSQRATELTNEAEKLTSVTLPQREQCDVEMIGIGAFSPLTGFVGEKDFNSICDTMRLANGVAWPVPVTCSVDEKTAAGIDVGQRLALRDDDGKLIAVLTVEAKFKYNKAKEAKEVFKTDSTEHPGVAVLMKQGDVCLGGPIEVMPDAFTPSFPENQMTPAQTRAEFVKRGWTTVVGFQTRNPIHRAHEYLTKCALEICDGLLIHPLVGQTQAGDIPADVRMKCYQKLMTDYYQPEHVMLSVLPAAMRYAGPREAILHALIRQNYGCTHFIVGRDHAGVGKYYGTYDAQEIFNEFKPGEMAITTLNFEHASWCKKCEGMVSSKTCPHPGEDKIFLSGTKVREMLNNGERPPMEFTRPEVADLLIAAFKK